MIKLGQTYQEGNVSNCVFSLKIQYHRKLGCFGKVYGIIVYIKSYILASEKMTVFKNPERIC